VNDLFLNDPIWQGHAVHLLFDDKELIALGGEDVFTARYGESSVLERFQQWLDSKTEWSFGLISYDVRLLIERLPVRKDFDPSLPLISWFRPLVLIERRGSQLFIRKNHSVFSDDELVRRVSETDDIHPHPSIVLNALVCREAYIEQAGSLLRHIRLGNAYEVNYCIPFRAEASLPGPYSVWRRLAESTAAPMAGYFRSGDHHLLSASPERFLQRTGQTIRSQPIKGTIRRGSTLEEDTALRSQLASSEKDMSENVMIVDLVRNDLSRSALPGTVRVEELFGIHSFRTVHHMISTVCAEVPANTSFTQLMRDTFPMGSMTGAPKVEAMKLIDAHETRPRGWYSGTLGYITPEGDFDLNVVIRSLVYDDKSQQLSCTVGSALTTHADPGMEYEECLLKLEAIRRVLQHEKAPITP